MTKDLITFGFNERCCSKSVAILVNLVLAVGIFYWKLRFEVFNN